MATVGVKGLMKQLEAGSRETVHNGGETSLLPYVCLIIANAATINLFNFLVQSTQHFLLIVCFEFSERKHPTKTYLFMLSLSLLQQ